MLFIVPPRKYAYVTSMLQLDYKRLHCLTNFAFNRLTSFRLHRGGLYTRHSVRIMDLRIMVALALVGVLAVIGGSDAGGYGHHHKKIIIHVPVQNKQEKHVHTIVKHIHHHHKPIVIKEEKIIKNEVHPIVIKEEKQEKHFSHEHLHHHHQYEHPIIEEHKEEVHIPHHYEHHEEEHHEEEYGGEH